jgi:hypothetical protein
LIFAVGNKILAVTKTINECNALQMALENTHSPGFLCETSPIPDLAIVVITSRIDQVTGIVSKSNSVYFILVSNHTECGFVSF